MKSLSQKDFETLWHIVDIYLEIRSPVSSKRLTERLGFMRSPATLRNIMAKLEQEGLLISQHCSSGRVPTSDALKLYIQRLRKTIRLQESTEDALYSAFDKPNTQFNPERIIQTITSLCKCASFFFLRAPQASVLKYLDFVYVTPEHALGVLVFEDDAVSSYCFHLPKNITPVHLHSYHAYLNPDIVMGQSLSKIREYVERHQGPLYLLECLSALECVVDSKQSSSNHMVIRGQSQLIDALSGATTLATFQSLLQWLETEDALVRILSQSTEEIDNFYIVFGRENDAFYFEGFNLVFTSFSYKNTQGAIGAIGPFYMDYQKIIPIIEKTTEFIKE